jgi:hypothetical protein
VEDIADKRFFIGIIAVAMWKSRESPNWPAARRHLVRIRQMVTERTDIALGIALSGSAIDKV